MIGHGELRVLSGSTQYHRLVGEYLHGASTVVSFDRDGERVVRVHLIVESSDFPRVKIAAQGSEGRLPVERNFFTDFPADDHRYWDLSSEADETALRKLISDHLEMNAAAVAATSAWLEERRLAREAAERAAEAARTVERRLEAQHRLLEAYRNASTPRKWDEILTDLDVVADTIDRGADRSFVTDLAMKRRVYRFPLSERQLSWLSDVFYRMGRLLQTKS